MNEELQNIQRFLEAFEFPVLQGPGLGVTQKFKDLQLKLLREEVGELQVALENDDLIGVYDALADIQYVTLGTVVMLGGRDIFTMVFDRVHQSNMSKLGEDGKPIHREDGKVAKSKDYRAPDLGPIFDWFSEREKIRAVNIHPNKIVYGTNDCGDPCKVKLRKRTIVRIKKFEEAIQNFLLDGFELNESEHIEINIRDLGCKVWDDDGRSVESNGAFISINRYGTSIRMYGYDGEHVVHDFDVDALKDVEVSRDLLSQMVERREWVHPGLDKFLDSIPSDHRRVLDAEAQAYRMKNPPQED